MALRLVSSLFILIQTRYTIILLSNPKKAVCYQNTKVIHFKHIESMFFGEENDYGQTFMFQYALDVFNICWVELLISLYLWDGF